MNTLAPRPCRFCLIFVLLSVVTAACPSVASAQGALIRKPVQEVVEKLVSLLGRTASKTAAEELAELGGEVVVREIVERAWQQGGDEAVEAVLKATRSFGPEALRAVKGNAVHIPRVLQAVDELPPEVARSAIRRLVAGVNGEVLAETVETYGSKALIAEVKHPGAGGALVARLGDDGAALADRLTTPQAKTLAWHADDIAALPTGPRDQVITLLNQHTDVALGFMRRFVEKNPGKVLFTAARLRWSWQMPSGYWGAKAKSSSAPMAIRSTFPKREWSSGYWTSL